MALSDAEAIRAFAKALRDYLSFALIAAKTGRTICADPDLAKEGERLIQPIRDHRLAAFKAGVYASETVDCMNFRLQSCHDFCSKHHTMEDVNGPVIAYNGLADRLAEYLQWLDGLAVVAQGRQPMRIGPVPRWILNEDRDKWIYGELCKSGHEKRSLQQILNKMNRMAKSCNWSPLDSIQALRQVAIHYAARNKLDRPKKRRPGLWSH